MVVDDVSDAIAATRIITMSHIHSATTEAHITNDDIVRIDFERFACHDNALAWSSLPSDCNIGSNQVNRTFQMYLACHIKDDDTGATCLTGFAQSARSIVLEACNYKDLSPSTTETIHTAAFGSGECRNSGLSQI